MNKILFLVETDMHICKMSLINNGLKHLKIEGRNLNGLSVMMDI